MMVNSTMTNEDYSKSAQKYRNQVKKALDTFYSEIEDLHMPKAMECASSEELWEYRNRLEEIKAQTYKMSKATLRNLSSANEIYQDGLRSAMHKSKSTGGLHFEERKAKYETSNITEYKTVRQLEHVKEDISEFRWWLEGRLRWVKDRQKWLREEEQYHRYNN